MRIITKNVQIDTYKQDAICWYFNLEDFIRFRGRWFDDGAYCSSNNPFASALNDKAYIQGQASALLSTPEDYTFEAGESTGVPTMSDFQNIGSLGDNLQSAGLLLLLTGDVSYRNALEAIIRANIDYENFDFSNQSFWQSPSSEIQSLWEVSGYMSALASAYSMLIYAKQMWGNSVATTLTSTEKKNLGKQIYYYFPEYIIDRYVYQFLEKLYIQGSVEKKGGRWFNPNPSGESNGLLLSAAGAVAPGVLFYPDTHFFSEITSWFSNRRNGMMMSAGLCALSSFLPNNFNLVPADVGLTTEQELLDKRWYFVKQTDFFAKQSLELSYYPFESDTFGMVCVGGEVYRSIGSNRSQGVQYEATSKADMLAFAIGKEKVLSDKSLFTHETILGRGETTDGVTKKSLFNACLYTCHLVANSTPYKYNALSPNTENERLQVRNTNGTTDYDPVFLMLQNHITPDVRLQRIYKRDPNFYPNCSSFGSSRAGFESLLANRGSGTAHVTGINAFYGID